MSLANGTAYVMPFSHIGIRTLVEHVRDDATGDKAGYFGEALSLIETHWSKSTFDAGDCARG